MRIKEYAKTIPVFTRLFAYSPIRLFAYSPIRLFAMILHHRLLPFLLPLALAGCGGASAVREPGAEAASPAGLRRPVSSVSLQPPLQLAWKTGLYGPLLSRPVAAGDAVYVPMSNYKIFRVRARDGARTETVKIKGIARVTPVLRNGVMYLSLAGPGSRDLRELLAYDLTRKRVLWRRPFDNAWSAPVVVDTTLYVGAEDGGVYAIDVETGKTRWSFMTARQVRVSPAVSDGTVFIGSNDNRVYALDAGTGALRWSHRTGGSITAAPVAAAGAVYAVSYDRHLYCLDAETGALRWRFAVDGSMYGAPVVQNGRVFVGSNDRHLYCLDAETGALRWRFATGGVVRASPLPAGAVVYAGSSDKRIYAVDIETGALRWKYETEGSITVSPVIAGGMLLVGAEDRHLYAFTNRIEPPVQE